MGESVLMQLGVGGVFVILALREIRAILADLYVRKKNGNGSDGNGYWQIEMRQQAKLLVEIRDELRRLSDRILQMTARQATE